MGHGRVEIVRRLVALERPRPRRAGGLGQKGSHRPGRQRPEGPRGMERLLEDLHRVAARDHDARREVHRIVKALAWDHGLAGRYLAISEGLHPKDSDPFLHQDRQDLLLEALEVRVHHVQRHLDRVEPEPVLRGRLEHPLMDRGILVSREPDVADPPCIPRLERCLDRPALSKNPVRILRPNDLVELQEIDYIRLESLERLLDLPGGRGPRLAVDLGHQKSSLAVAVPKGFPHADLAPPLVVVPGVVEEIDARVDRGSDDAKALRLREVYALGYEAPTPIQKEAIPAVLAGRDVIGTAQTGSGKTAAFLLPILQRLLKQPPGRTRALVLSPTRELAAQIEVALRGLAKGTRIRGHAVYGGVGMAAQEHALRAGVDVVVATPGRLLDHMSRRNVDFRGLQVLVLDEADRMLDMGFLPDVRRIVDALPRDRQTLLFSATMLPEIEVLSRTIMRNPARISVSPPHRPPTTIRHEVYPVPQHLKTSLLVRLLGREDMMSVLVFVRTKRRADRVARQVGQAGFDVARIHGDRSQSQRETALAGFRSGRHQILIATDVAARGIDVEGISHVINYDIPTVATDYVHRVGRTARMEAQGEAITFVTPEDEGDLRGIERALGRTSPRVKLTDFVFRATKHHKVRDH